MLVILFGMTMEVGTWSREFFEAKGFERISKKNYVPTEYSLPERFGKRTRNTKEEVLACDFVYENNGRLVGFNKEQILDAVRGQKKCLLMATGSTIDFIRQIKAAYGDYVTVMGTYIDESTMLRLVKALPEVTQEEIDLRVETSRQIKEILLSDLELFDSIILYGGENTAFNIASLEKQYTIILKKAEKAERELNNQKYVEMPYSGSKDYVFVSYSHADENTVLPILHKLQRTGCRIWFDAGIRGGENWRQILATKIQSDQCRHFLLFSSGNSASSRNVLAEIKAALFCEKKIATIRIDDEKFALDTEMYLQTYQQLFISDEQFEQKLLDSLEKSVFEG